MLNSMDFFDKTDSTKPHLTHTHRNEKWEKSRLNLPFGQCTTNSKWIPWKSSFLHLFRFVCQALKVLLESPPFCLRFARRIGWGRLKVEILTQILVIPGGKSTNNVSIEWSLQFPPMSPYSIIKCKFNNFSNPFHPTHFEFCLGDFLSERGHLKLNKKRK